MALLSHRNQLVKNYISTISTRKKSYYDIVIVGGGMIGNAMACSIGLSSSLLKDKNVLLLDSQEKDAKLTELPIFSNRVSAISPSSVSLFRKLGIWDDLMRYRAKQVDRFQVLDSCSNSTLKLEQPDETKEIAYIVENHAINALLRKRTRETGKNIKIKQKTAVDECLIPKNSFDLSTLKLEDGTEIITSLIIGADGLRSKIRQSTDITYSSWDYGQKGLVATLEIEATNYNSTAWQRFMPTGPIALLPLTESLSSLVWTTSNNHAETLLQLPPDQFVDQLNQHLRTKDLQQPTANNMLQILDSFININSDFEYYTPKPPVIISLQTDTRAAFPLGFGHSHSYVAQRTALIGDAAHRTHPLAGQGANIGWRDVAILTQTLEACANNGEDLGSLSYLSDYDSKSRKFNLIIQLACDWINRLYRSDALPNVFLRAAGVYAVDKAPILKIPIIRSTSPIFE